MQYYNEDLQYSPSQWVVRLSAEKVVGNHIHVVTQESIKVRQTTPHELDLLYGIQEKECFDVYGTDLPKDSPLFVYIHGGYWQDLSKDISAYPVVPLWRSGIRTAVVGYDLAPSVTLDAIVEEIRQMAKFVLGKARKDSCKCVWIGGHSAGAHLAASLLDSNWLFSIDEELRRIFKGVVLVSGIYDLTPLVHTCINEALSLTREEALRLSPLYQQVKFQEQISVLVVVGQYDSPSFHGQAKAYTEMLKRTRIQTKLMEIFDTDHFNVVENLKDPSYILTKEIISMIQSESR